MARVIINGTLETFSPPNGILIHFDPTRGTTVEQDFVCAGDNLAGWAMLMLQENIAFDWVRSPVKSTLRITYSGGVNGIPDNAQPNWQLLGNEMQSSIYESAFALQAEQDAHGTIAKARRAVQAIQNGEISVESITDGPPPVTLASLLAEFFGSTSVSGAVTTLVGFAIKNQTHFSLGQPVLRRTYSISNFYNGSVDTSGAESLLSMGAILDFDMPRAIRNAVGDIAIPDAHDGYAWAWRQLPSTLTTSANNRVEVSTEWWWAEWSTDLYG